jgi:hypothetical protein
MSCVKILTSSGSDILNSQLLPVHVMHFLADLSESSSSRNCHSWMGPPCPGVAADIGRGGGGSGVAVGAAA